MMTFGKAHLEKGAVTSKSEFVKLLIAGRYRGDIEKAWEEYSGGIPNKPSKKKGAK